MFAATAHANGAGQCTVPTNITASGAIAGMQSRSRDGVNFVRVTPPIVAPGGQVQIEVAGAEFIGMIGAVYWGGMKVGTHTPPTGAKLCNGVVDAITHSAPFPAGTTSLKWTYTVPPTTSGEFEIRVITLVGLLGGSASAQKFALGKATLSVRSPVTTTLRPTQAPANATNTTTTPFCPNAVTPNRSSPCGDGCTYLCGSLPCILRSSGIASWQVTCNASTNGTAATTRTPPPTLATATGNPSDFALNGDKFSVVYRKSSHCRSSSSSSNGGGSVPVAAPEPTAWNSTWINWGSVRTAPPTVQPSGQGQLTWVRVVVATNVANTDSEWKSQLSLVLDLAKGELKESETWTSTSGLSSKMFVFSTPDICATFRKLQSLSANAAQRLSLGGADIVERNDKFQFRADDDEPATIVSAASNLIVTSLAGIPAVMFLMMQWQ